MDHSRIFHSLYEYITTQSTNRLYCTILTIKLDILDHFQPIQKFVLSIFVSAYNEFEKCCLYNLEQSYNTATLFVFWKKTNTSKK